MIRSERLDLGIAILAWIAVLALFSAVIGDVFR